MMRGWCGFAQLTPASFVKEFSVTGFSVLKWLCSPVGHGGQKGDVKRKRYRQGKDISKVAKLLCLFLIIIIWLCG